MSNDNLILCVGAGGHFAGLVVPELARRGAKVRGLVHQESEREAVLQKGAAEVMVGDLTERASIEAALAGVWGVFYIPPVFLPGEAQVGQQFVEAARDAGVRRFVFSSVIHPVLSALSNHAAKAPVEESLLDSEMEWVFLQPALFYQNFAAGFSKMGGFSDAVESGKYGEPWSAQTKFSRVDYRDVAEVAAIALTEDRLNYGTFELSAPGHLNRVEVAALMSEVAGKPIEAITPPAPDGAGEEIKKMFDWYDHHGLLGNPLVLRAILGREPRSLRAYFEELATSS